MAGQILLVGAALGAAYLASKKATAAKPASPADINSTDREQVGVAGTVDATAAAANPGKYTAADGSPAESSMGALNQDVITNGSTSNTPSGDVTGGSTSTTPSAGPTSIPIVGAVMTPDATSSPSGPTPVMTAERVDIPTLKYGSTSGLTIKQQSAALMTDGATMGLVW